MVIIIPILYTLRVLLYSYPRRRGNNSLLPTFRDIAGGITSLNQLITRYTRPIPRFSTTLYNEPLLTRRSLPLSLTLRSRQFPNRRVSLPEHYTRPVTSFALPFFHCSESSPSEARVRLLSAVRRYICLLFFDCEGAETVLFSNLARNLSGPHDSYSYTLSFAFLVMSSRQQRSLIASARFNRNLFTRHTISRIT